MSAVKFRYSRRWVAKLITRTCLLRQLSGFVSGDGIFKLLRSPGIDSRESISPSYIAWRSGTATLFLLGSWPLWIVLKFQHRHLLKIQNGRHTVSKGVANTLQPQKIQKNKSNSVIPFVSFPAIAFCPATLVPATHCSIKHIFRLHSSTLLAKTFDCIQGRGGGGGGGSFRVVFTEGPSARIVQIAARGLWKQCKGGTTRIGAVVAYARILQWEFQTNLTQLSPPGYIGWTQFQPNEMEVGREPQRMRWREEEKHRE